MDRRVDLVLGLLVVALGLAVVVLARDIRPTGPVVDVIGPRAIPTMIGAFFLAGGLWIVRRRLRLWRHESGPDVETDGEPDEQGVPASAGQAVTIMAAAVIHAATLPSLGYILSTPLFVAIGLRAMRMRSWTTIAATAALYTALTYGVFAVAMGVDLPLGPLADLFRAAGLAR